MKSVFSTIVLFAMMFMAVGFTACSNGNQAADETAASTAEQFEPDSRFASIDSLADYMLARTSEVNATQGLIGYYESVATAMKSYWHLNHNTEDINNMTQTACSDLTALADSLSGGSTADMMLSGELKGAIARYLTGEKFIQNHQKNPLYQEEMDAWLQLENKLLDFYGNLTQVANWGGSIVNVIQGGNIANVANARWQDYSQLAKGGQFASSEMPINEARTELIQEINDAKSLEDGAVDDPDFNKTLNNMRQAGDELIPLLDKWLATRAKIAEAEGIPEAHTAHVIQSMAQQIQELIEG